MTETFRASYGARIEVHDNNSRIDIKCTVSSGEQHFLSVKETQAAREFFQHERDEELGRWRWPENPEYVAYRRDAYPGYKRRVRVIHEPDGDFVDTVEGSIHDGIFKDAARAYFEAHPERKPWDTASAGELWAFKTDPGTRETLWERDASESHWHLPGQTKAELGIHFTIVTGRKIWPEDAS